MFSGLNHGEELVRREGHEHYHHQEHDHDGQAVEDPLHHNGGQGGCLTDLNPVPQEEGPDKLPHPGRKQVIGHEADGRGLIQFHQGDLFH